MSALKEILGYYGMPEENIDTAIEQIAETYGACRYLDGVAAGAEAVAELAESEDEKIRKSLIKSCINSHSSNFPTVDGFTREQILTWLEKQKEQKSVDYEAELKKCKDNPLYFYDKYVSIKLKSAWSKDDEEMKRTIVSNLFILKKMYTKPEMQTDYNNMIEWLKSLKPNHWKPSEEQLNELCIAKNFFSYNTIYRDSKVAKQLETLYDDLKKL